MWTLMPQSAKKIHARNRSYGRKKRGAIGRTFPGEEREKGRASECFVSRGAIRPPFNFRRGDLREKIRTSAEKGERRKEAAAGE